LFLQDTAGAWVNPFRAMISAATNNLVIDDERGIFRVQRRTFTDPDILAAERRAIFDRS